MSIAALTAGRRNSAGEAPAASGAGGALPPLAGVGEGGALVTGFSGPGLDGMPEVLGGAADPGALPVSPRGAGPAAAFSSFQRVEVAGGVSGSPATSSDALVLGDGRLAVRSGHAGGPECAILSREGLRSECGEGLRLEGPGAASVVVGGSAVAVEAPGGLAVSAGDLAGVTSDGDAFSTVRFSRLPRGGFSLATDARLPAAPPAGGDPAPRPGLDTATGDGGVTLTVEGHECQFPMLIAGTEHYACVPFEGAFWCLDSRGLWDQCAGQADAKGFRQKQLRQKARAPPAGSRAGDLEVRAAGNLTLTTGASGGGVRVRGAGGGIALEGGVTVAAAPRASSLRVQGLADADAMRVGAGGLEVDGAVAADGGLRVEGGARLAAGLSVGGPADLRAGLTVSGPASFPGPEPSAFGAGVQVGASLEVAEETQLQGALFVAGESSLQSLRLSGNADVAGKGSFARLAARRSLTVHGRLDVPGTASVRNLTVDGLTVHNLTVTGSVLGLPTEAGGLRGAGASGAAAQMVGPSQNLRVQNSLRVGGPAVLGKGVEVAGGPVRAAAGLEVEGSSELERAQVQDLEVTSALDVRAAARFRNRPVFEKGFAVRGAQQKATFAGGAEFAGDVAVAGDFSLTGKASLKVGAAEVGVLRAGGIELEEGADVRGARLVGAEQVKLGQTFPPAFDRMTLLVGGSGVVSGSFTLGESMAVGGDVNVPDGRLTAGHLTSAASLEVGGDGVVEGTLSVVGETLAMGAARVGADLSVAGEARVGGDLVVRSAAAFGGDLVVDGNLVVKGEIRREGEGGGQRARGRGGGSPGSGTPRGRLLAAIPEPADSYVEADASAALPEGVALAAVTKCGIELRLPTCRDPGRVVQIRDVSGSASLECPVVVAGAWGGGQGGVPGPEGGGAVALEEPFSALDAFCTGSGRWFRLSGGGRPLPAR